MLLSLPRANMPSWSLWPRPPLRSDACARKSKHLASWRRMFLTQIYMRWRSKNWTWSRSSYRTRKRRLPYRYCPAILRMIGQRCWKFVPERAAMKPLYSRAICTACMNAMPLGRGGRLSRFRSAPPTWVDIRKWWSRSKAQACLPS